MKATRVIARAAAAAMIALAAAAAPAYAQTDAAQLKAARAVMEASGGANSLRDIVPIFLDEAKRTFTRTNPDLAKDLDEVVKGLTPEFERRRDQLLNEIAEVYAERFSAKELADIKAFYDTPTGVKLVKTLPGILQESYEKTTAWSQEMTQDVITRIRQEMKKRGHDL